MIAARQMAAAGRHQPTTLVACRRKMRRFIESKVMVSLSLKAAPA
jgi:hypothetical protein